MSAIDNRGTRGKWAEGEITKAFKKYAEYPDFAFHRFPDARAGNFQPAPCDFMYMSKGQFNVLEVKEVKHAYLLPKTNFPGDQRARMRLWKLAGAQTKIAIFFKPTNHWRVHPLEFFECNGAEIGVAKSWSFIDEPLLTFEQALAKLVVVT